jgi:transposase InsO family protein
MRKHLIDGGFDAGAATIHYHLTVEGPDVPSIRTIHRVLVRRGFVTPQPRKRPRSSFIRFEAQLPNECWQSDVTHWTAWRQHRRRDHQLPR